MDQKIILKKNQFVSDICFQVYLNTICCKCSALVCFDWGVHTPPLHLTPTQKFSHFHNPSMLVTYCQRDQHFYSIKKMYQQWSWNEPSVPTWLTRLAQASRVAGLMSQPTPVFEYPHIHLYDHTCVYLYVAFAPF